MLSRDVILQHLDHYLQNSNFSDYSVNGLQIEGKIQVNKIATAVTASLHVIKQAIKEQSDLLIVHHGLFWANDPYIITGSKKEKIATLLASQLSLVAYHLPLDAHKEIGNNWQAAKALNFQSIAPFYSIKGQAIGVKGSFPKISCKDFQLLLENYYGQKAQVVFGGKNYLESCALVSGGAYKQIKEAALEKVDGFITGNVDEPAWHLAKEERINFFALGHHATEKIGPLALAKYLSKTFNLECFFIDEPNPF